MKTKVKEKRKAKDLPVELLLMLMMSTCMIYPFVTALELGQSLFSLVCINLIFIALWTVVFYNNRNLLLGIVLLALSAGALALFYLMHDDAGTYSAFHYSVDDFLYWAGMYMKGYRTANAVFSRYLVVFFSGFVCMAVSLFTVRRFSLAAVVLCGAGCFVSLFVIGHVINMPSLFGYILASIFYFLLHNYKRNSKETVSGKGLSLPAFMASALPLAALVLALTILLSSLVAIDPVWMKETRDKLLKKSEPVNNIVSRDSAGLVVNSNELGGNLYLNDDVVMTVASPVGNVYLKAMSKDEYTGHSWDQSSTDASGIDPSGQVSSDTAELQGSAPALSGDDELFDRLFPSYEITVNYAVPDFGIVYAPLKTSNLKVPGSIILVGDDELMLTANPPKGFSYSLRFYQPQYGSEELAGLLRDCPNVFAQPASGSATADNDLYAVGDGLYNAAAHYDGSQLLAKYLQLPSSLPGRVRDLAEEITQGSDNGYDKAMAVAQYLSENFSYTLTPGSVDKSKDFVDQFLFVSKKGYCTYYASAMAVMLRCIGIPARYVEGYVLPQRSSDTGLFNVTKRQGHAWVEAYFQGLGWIQFEPTASFSNDASEAETAKPSNTPVKPSALPSHSAAPAHTQPSLAVSAARSSRASALPVLLLVVAALLAMAYALLHRSNALLRKMKPRAAALLLFGQYLRLLAHQGVAMQNGETSALFAKRVDKLYGLGGSAFRKSAEIFQLARYSEHEISEDQKALMLSFRNVLLAASRQKLGLVRYLFYRLLWSI